MERPGRKNHHRFHESNDSHHTELSMKERVLVKGIAVDCGKTETSEATKYRDDAFWLERTANGYNLQVTIADVASVIPKNSKLDLRAFKTNDRRLFPDDVLHRDLSLKGSQERPTVTIAIPLDTNFNPGEAQISLTRLQLGRAGKLTHQDVEQILEDPADERNEFFADCARAAFSLRCARGSKDMLVMTPRSAPALIVQEFMTLANSAIASYCVENNIPLIFKGKRKRDSGKLGPSFYTSQAEEHMGFGGAYAGITSPLWQLDALVNQRTLVAHLNGRPSAPYTVRELNEICKTMNRRELSEGELQEIYRGDKMALSRRKKVTDPEKVTRQSMGLDTHRTVFFGRKNVVPYGESAL